MSVTLEAYANRDPESSGYLGTTQIGQGTYKLVTRGTYESGALAADKFLKTGVTFSSDCFLDDLRASEAALPYVAGFHRYIDTATGFRGRVSIMLNMPQVWDQLDGTLRGQKVLREPFIDNFQKFNSNSGAADVTATVAQALSHYSYHASDGTELLCDLQGGKIGDSYVLSDVVMMSMTKKYGNTDLGATGIENWLHSHRCTQFCSSSWKNWSGARRLIQPAFSTTMTLDVTTAPAVGQEFVRVRPTTIKFTHDSVKDRFQDGHTLLETALQIARQDIGKRDLRMLNVVRVDDGRMFSLDNRRLAVFRLLEICGKVGTIKVELVPYHTWADEWNRKVSTKTGGETISVRQGNYQIGATLASTSIPWLQQIRNANPMNQVMADSEFSIFLATFTDE
jgi:hypothetical protein